MLPEMNSNSIFGQNWMVCFEYAVRAPSKTFEEQKPLLYATAKSLRPTAKWFTQMIELRGKLIEQNHENVMATIRKRGEFYSNLSDSNMKAWIESQAVSDRKQNDFIKTINEVSDLRDADGQGNDLMTNSETLPRGDWTVIKPVR